MNEYIYMRNGTEHGTILATTKKEAKKQFDATFGRNCQVELNRTDKELLIEQVISQIEKDILEGDTTALAELLAFLPKKYLIGFLPSI